MTYFGFVNTPIFGGYALADVGGMTRPTRLDLPGIPQHIVQRGVDRRPCFLLEIHYRLYLQLLEEYSLKFECDVHAFVLMSNHVHLLATPNQQGGIGTLMQAVGRKFVSFVNYTLDRTGTLWEGRYKSCLVGDDPYVLACYRYIELNPVRACMVSRAAEYPWSSHRTNAYGAPSSMLSPHPAYSGLAETVESRCSTYLEWLAGREGRRDEESIRLLTNRQRAFGDDAFRAQLEGEYCRPMGPLKPGRPRKTPEPSVPESELRL